MQQEELPKWPAQERALHLLYNTVPLGFSSPLTASEHSIQSFSQCRIGMWSSARWGSDMCTACIIHGDCIPGHPHSWQVTVYKTFPFVIYLLLISAPLYGSFKLLYVLGPQWEMDYIFKAHAFRKAFFIYHSQNISEIWLICLMGLFCYFGLIFFFPLVSSRDFTMNMCITCSWWKLTRYLI